jgi:hypothetical protein
VLLLAVAGLLLLGGCMSSSPSNPPRRDINAVLSSHEQELLALPGVVGVYVGLLSNGRTPCLKVMLARKDPGSAARVPSTLEGYPVTTEVTGEIRPLH